MIEARRLTKNEKRRQRKKENVEPNGTYIDIKLNIPNNSKNNEFINNVEIEYVSADYEKDIAIDPNLLEQFKSIFEKFTKPEELLNENLISNEIIKSESNLVDIKGNEIINKIDDENKTSISKKKKKLLNRLSVAELKQLVQRPDVVEAHDVTSSDPRLLVYLKSYRNSVSVPRHWCHIRKYLTGKVGMEKPPFQLPEFIAETGIAKIRDAVMEQEALKKSKAKIREKIRPKMGKIDIDYQVLHDAFFKYQTKPKLSSHGDLYYEGKEYEVNMKEMKPGMMSKELLNALGMISTNDNNSSSNSINTIPPPWLINMQRYGPPPSYPLMKIPGLNAPLPPGTSYGYQPGGWGKPPVDEYGRPVYGDVFGATTEIDNYYTSDQVVNKTLRWGAIEAEEYFENIEEDEIGEEGEDIDSESSRLYDPSGAETPSTIDGLSSGISGLETPDTVDLRKRAGMDTPESSYASTSQLYHVIQEKQSTSGAAVGQMFGSDHTYILPGQAVITSTTEYEEGFTDLDTSQSGGIVDGSHTEDTQGAGGKGGAGKKRKLDSSTAAMKRIKDFKF